MSTNDKPATATFERQNGMEIGIYTLADHLSDPKTGEKISQEDRIHQIIELAQLAEKLGFDVFQVGESHQPGFVAQSHLVILAAIAQATEKIKIGSSVTTLSIHDPVRIYEDATTVQMISKGRMELTLGRASRFGSYQLFGYNMADYDDLFVEKLDLLVELMGGGPIDWEGKYRPPLKLDQIYPTSSKPIPLWRGVGNTLNSAREAGEMGIGLYQAHLAGAATTYKNKIDTYRQAGEAAGFDPASLPVSTAGIVLPADTVKDAQKMAYEYLNSTLERVNGQGLNKRVYAQAKDKRSVMTIGNVDLIIEKLLYQYELFQPNRFVAQLDFGGMPHQQIIDHMYILAEEIMPVIKQATKSN